MVFKAQNPKKANQKTGGYVPPVFCPNLID